jgi:hypothetical protein
MVGADCDQSLSIASGVFPVVGYKSPVYVLQHRGASARCSKYTTVHYRGGISLEYRYVGWA